ncbi:type VII secretion protein EccE [Dactylosporangium sp. NPDC049140]|uniref:type VII secretion protein EccE n=1 Tax=Dactylosporangium sp. NPDC049140 TaxID=3155647 RepID=UPI0033E362E4
MSARTRIVLAQGAAALLVAAWALGRTWALVALPLAVVLAATAVLRLRPRWIGDGPRWAVRRRGLSPGAGPRWAVRPRWALGRRGLSPGAGPPGLLALVRPGAATSTLDVDGADVGVLEDTDGLAAIVRVGAVSDLLGTALPPLPPLSALLPTPARDVPEVRVQLLVSAVTAPAPSATPSATSYRQLTEGRVLAHQRVLVAVRVRRAGGYRRADLERSLLAALRRVQRLLTKAGLPARPLSAPSALAAIAEAAQHDPAHPVRETWSGVQIGGLHQAALRVRRWPDEGPLTSRLLVLPTSVTTLSLTASAAGELGGTASTSDAGGPPVRAELVVRLAAPSAATLAHAVAALRRLAEGTGAQVTRLDGAQLDGLAATLPLGGAPPGDDALLAGLLSGHDGLAPGGGDPVSVSAPRLAAAAPIVGGEGVMIGINRRGEPMVVRLFRPEPTRATLIGGPRCAQLVVLRALATGARVVVQSSRPRAWEPFQRGLGPSEALAVVPPGRLPEPPPATATRPQLLVVDVGPVPARAALVPESAWRTVLFLRDELTTADVDLLIRSDLALLQPLSPHEAALAGDALGLGASESWLTKIDPEMLGVVVNRQTVRWTRLSTTPIELQLTGGPAR